MECVLRHLTGIQNCINLFRRPLNIEAFVTGVRRAFNKNHYEFQDQYSRDSHHGTNSISWGGTATSPTGQKYDDPIFRGRLAIEMFYLN